jgi:hypothetical protein
LTVGIFFVLGKSRWHHWDRHHCYTPYWSTAAVVLTVWNLPNFVHKRRDLQRCTT